MNTLDDLQAYGRLDPSDMLGHIRRLPEHCELAWQQALKFDLPHDYTDIKRVVVLGMGGSAIGGELALGLLGSKAFGLVQRDYDLPAPLDKETLVIASSYSGETEETLTAFQKALGSPAKTLAITTGGKLKALAEGHKKPVFVIKYKAPPRAALAYSLMPILAVLHKVGLLPDVSADVREAKEAMTALAQRIGEKLPSSENSAKQLAARLHGKIGVIYGAEFLGGVARRWKTQINENSKGWAFFEVLPELNHNAVVGYEYPKELLPHLFVVMLRSNLLNPRIQKRYQVTAEILARASIAQESVDAGGKSAFSQMMNLVLYGDYVSYYLALLNQVDPTPVKVIDSLKQSLK